MAYTQKAMGKTNALPPLLLLHGADTFRSRLRLRTLRDTFRQTQDPANCNAGVLEGKGLSLEELERNLTAAPFLAAQRLVVVEGLLASKPKADVQERIIALLARAKTTQVIFWESELTATQLKASLVAQIKTAGAVEHFAPLSSGELTAWVLKRANELGSEIAGPAADMLVSAVGDDLWRADGELKKLTAFASGRRIETDDVRQLTPARWQEESFALADAIGSRSAPAALRHSRALLRHGVSAPEVLGQVTWQFRNLLAVKSLLTEIPQLSSGQVAVQLKLHPFVARKTMAQADRFSLDELIATYRQLLAVDLHIKSSPGDPGAVFDLLLLRLASGRPRGGG